MKLLTLLKVFIALLINVTAVLGVIAQGGGPPPNGGNEFGSGQNRPNLLQELGLNRNQVQQIKRINSERGPQTQIARKRLDDANLALDEAIYGDTYNESEIQARLKEAQSAQSELNRIRTFTETAIRNMLTPEQLVRFRKLRNDFKARPREMRRPPNQEDGNPKNPSRQNNPRKGQVFGQRPPI